MESFFGRELADAGIRILVLLGADNALALPDAQLLHTLQIPRCLTLDNTSDLRAELLNKGRLSTGETKAPSKEERIHAAVAVAARFRDLPVTHIPLDMLDMERAIPEDAIKLDVPSFPGWDQATAAIKARRGKIKDLLQELYGMRVNSETLGRWIATTQEIGLEPDHRLKSAIALTIEAVETHR